MRLPGDHKDVQEEPEESENRFPVSVPINVKALPPPEPPGGTPLAGSLLVVVRLITFGPGGVGREARSSTHGVNNSRPSPAGARPGSTPPLNEGDPPC